jgi:hypothetical protein
MGNLFSYREQINSDTRHHITTLFYSYNIYIFYHAMQVKRFNVSLTVRTGGTWPAWFTDTFSISGLTHLIRIHWTSTIAWTLVTKGTIRANWKETVKLLRQVYWQHDRVVRYISNVRTDRQMLTDMYFEKGAFFVYENAYFNV